MKIADIKFVPINRQNLNVFKNLSQGYEAEYSSLTKRMPNKRGLFKIDTFPSAPYVGYLLYYQNIPIGFCVADVESEIKEIFDFYIIPAMRNNKFGYQLAIMFFEQYPGEWQTRQIKDADNAIKFWRSVIKKYTQDKYDESVVSDVYWETVTLQRFKTPDKK